MGRISLYLGSLYPRFTVPSLAVHLKLFNPFVYRVHCFKTLLEPALLPTVSRISRFHTRRSQPLAIFCALSPVTAMASSEFDGDSPKPKTYVEAAVYSQRVFD